MPPDRCGAASLSVGRIAILRALPLGDLLISTPAWRALRQRFPQAEVTLIGLPAAAELMPHVPDLIDRLVALPDLAGGARAPGHPAHGRSFLAAQRACRYDLAIQMHDDGQAGNALVAALGARLSLGYARPGDARLDIGLPYQPAASEGQRWLDLVAAVGAPPASPRPQFRLLPEQRARLAGRLCQAAAGGPVIGLHLGAGGPARPWPIARFAALAAELRRLTGACFVLAGSAAAAPLAAELRGRLDVPMSDLTGQGALGELAALIAELDLLITSDTAASQLAAATATPSVVLFGPDRPARLAPPDPELHRPVDALDHVVGTSDGAAALSMLPVEPVLAAALAQLARRFVAAGGWRERELA